MTHGSGRLAAHQAPALRSVERLNRAVSARVRQGHMARGICAALAAAATTVSLAVMEGHPLEDEGLLLLMVLVAALTFTAWRGAHRLTGAMVAARVDGALGLKGAYESAVEAARHEHPTVLSELGAERVAAAVSRRSAVEAAVPHTVSFVALPLLSSALLVAAVGAQDSEGAGAYGERARSFKISNDLTALARDGAMPMDAAAREAIQRAASAAAAAGGSPGSRQQDMREVAEELEELALDAPPGSDLAEALARAAAAAEALALEDGHGEPVDERAGATSDAELDAEGAPGEVRTEGALAEASGGEAGDAAGADGTRAEGAGTTDAGATAARSGDEDAGGGDGRGTGASGRSEGGGGVAAASAEDRATRTTMGARWWDVRDAGIVSRWVALQRPGDGGAAGGR